MRLPLPGRGLRRREAVGAAAALAAAALAQWALRHGGLRASGSEPPEDPADVGTSWRAALAWGAGSGIVMGTARVLGRRLAAEVA